VSTTGSDTNGGTTVGTAFATLQKAFDVISQTYLVIKGIIKIDIQPGIYAQTSSFPSNIRTNERIQIVGKKDGSGIPSVIFEGNGLIGSGIFANERAYLLVQDIKFQNYRNAGQTAAGIHVQHFANLYTDNVHILNCDWGISATSSRLYTKGGVVDGCLYGVKMYSNSLGTIGYNAGGFGLGTLIKNCTNAGVHLQNQCSAHTDFCVVDGNRDGIVCVNESRAHVLQCDIKNQTGIGVKLYQGSTWFNDSNTFTNNVKNWSHLSFSTELVLHQDAKATLLSTINVDASTLTGNTTLSQLKSGTVLPANSFMDKGRKIRIKAFGTFTGAGTKTIQARLSPAGLALGFTAVNLTGNWELDVSIYALGTASQKIFGKFTEDDGTTRKSQLSRITKTYDFAVQETVSVWGQLSDSAGSIIIDVLEVEEVI
jgi:hypothetical protein